MYILGISAYYHDSAAVIIKNDEIIAAVQEERFSRKKNDSSIPINAINYCLFEANVIMENLDVVVYYENPVMKLDRWLATLTIDDVSNNKKYKYNKFINDISKKMHLIDELREYYGKIGKKYIIYTVPHHYSHAASAFFPSPFREAAVLIVDGVGEWSTTTLWSGNENKLKMYKELKFPNSLGLLYSAFTYFCGFKVNSGEYKLMGLAPYGKEVYVDVIKNNLINICDDGSFSINLKYFNYLDSEIMINTDFINLFGIYPRKPESELTEEYMNIAASIQKVTEEIIIKLAKKLSKNINSKNLVMAGGVALNCSANGKLLLKKYFSNIWIQPASGDAGGALGAALGYYYQRVAGKRKLNDKYDFMSGSYLGPKYTNNEIINYLKFNNILFHEYSSKDCIKEVVKLMSEGNIIGYFNGRMEYGPRSLGARSILADPRSVNMQEKINRRIKFRESFRPFAPAVLEEDACKYFNINMKSPYMLFTVEILNSRKSNIVFETIEKAGGDLLNYLHQSRSDIPSVTHVDYTSRVQTVSKETNPYFYEILNQFKILTGYSLCINTSFNVRGEPIVCTPEDAYRCFMKTDMDILVLENFILYKNQQNYNFNEKVK